MSRSTISPVTVVACLLALHLAVAVAGAASLARWEKRLERVEKKLDASDWKEAIDRSRKLRQRIVEEVEDASRLLPLAARTLVLQAVAEANLGRDDDARWHWHAAQSWIPDLPELDLSAYGRAAGLLGGLSAEETPQRWISPPPSSGETEPRTSYREVRIRRVVEPDYPRALRRSGMRGSVTVELVIDDSGRPRRPRVLDAGLVPTMAFPALDALGHWDFEPAQRDGQRIAVLYELRIDYR